jgi:hypothetical protein
MKRLRELDIGPASKHKALSSIQKYRSLPGLLGRCLLPIRNVYDLRVFKNSSIKAVASSALPSNTGME